MKTTNTKTTDEQLNEATIAQLTWKPNIVRNIALKLCERFLKDRIAYTDEIDLSFVPTLHANCIGLTFRRLRDMGIIKETGRFRQNSQKTRPGRKGGKAFQWRIISDKRARLFMERNGWLPNLCTGQDELFPGIPMEKPPTIPA